VSRAIFLEKRSNTRWVEQFSWKKGRTRDESNHFLEKKVKHTMSWAIFLEKRAN